MSLLIDLRVDKARITASFVITSGKIEEIRVPDYFDIDERGVLLAVCLSDKEKKAAAARWEMLGLVPR